MATIPSTAELQDQILHIKDNAVADIIVVNVVCFTIACTSVLLRFLARRVARVKYALDDWLIIAGLVRSNPVCFHLKASSERVLHEW